MRYGGNMRTFEAAGVGVVQVTDDLPGTREWFMPGETIVTYHDNDDLRDKIAHYLTHDDERLSLAQRAREHVYQHHTYEQRLDRLEQLITRL
jgi:spore maturation protein CgeB